MSVAFYALSIFINIICTGAYIFIFTSSTHYSCQPYAFSFDDNLTSISYCSPYPLCATSSFPSYDLTLTFRSRQC